ncbi:MAG: helix-turn-helix transcriptional regulator [Paenibacillus sp.]|uniref:helix-turn-helix transcriptional regulator n=1 Tax=Paenibacillus sp. TaxID=58172 RepID=UPI0029135C4A|nr:helix-turn-helix transcriptional regulator [Paenibacillus sp.]MDU4696664.1 helix-turn-helix transcriptional regulator [Paenibacillus sp.]
MNQTTTILAEISDFMHRESLNISQLSRLAGLNSGTVSSMINGRKVMSVEQLDRLTALMGLPEGFFYEEYVRDYLTEASPNWRRIKPFLYRCADLGKLGCIQQTVDFLMDNLMYSSPLFEVAEDFFRRNKRDAAALLYEVIAESEQKQHSERLAVCQYRLFMIRQGTDQEQNYQAAIRFEPFVERLDEVEQLDALKDLANTYRALNRWDKVEKIVERLEHKGKLIYFSDRRVKSTFNKPNRPLFFYLAYSYLLRGNISELQGNYEEALRYIECYGDLSWVKENDQETRYWMKLFIEWADANSLLTKLSSGDLSVFPEFVTKIESNKDDIIPSLLNVMEIANRFNIEVDEILERYKMEIDLLSKQPVPLGLYTEQTISDCISRLFIELAIYYLYKRKYEIGFTYIIQSLKISSSINNKACIIRCVGLFEHYRDYASSDILLAYKTIINEVYENEKKVDDIAHLK